MAKVSTGTIIGFIVVLIMIGVLIPIGLDGLTDYTGAYNSSISGVEVSGTNTTVGTLVSTIIPIMIVITIILGFVSAKSGKGGVA